MIDEAYKEALEQVPEKIGRLIDRKIDIAKQIAKYIKESRKKKKQFAEDAGIKPQYLSRVLAGEANLTLKTIVRLEAAIGKDIITTPLLEDIKGKAVSHLSEDIEAEKWITYPARIIETYSGRIITGIQATQGVLYIESGDDVMSKWLKIAREREFKEESFKVPSEGRGVLPGQSEIVYA